MIQESINMIHSKSVKLYLRRQELELQIQQIQFERQQVDMALIKLDGELEALERLQNMEVKDGK